MKFHLKEICLMRHLRLFLVVFLAVIAALAAYEWYKIKRMEQYRKAAVIAEGLQEASMVKAIISQYAEVNGRLPASNRELGIPEPAAFNRTALVRLEVTTNGTIILTYNEKSGVANGAITLIPVIGASAGGMVWRCETASFKDIESWAPQCRYVQ